MAPAMSTGGVIGRDLFHSWCRVIAPFDTPENFLHLVSANGKEMDVTS